MAKNIDQVFIANPITSNSSTDLMYFGQSPYGAGNDAAMTYANFKLQFASSTLTSADFFVGNGSNVATGVAMSGDAALSNTGAVTVSKIGGVSISLAGSFTTSGAFSVTQTYTGATSVTFPTSGTLATTSQIPSGAALTEVNDTNVTLTLGGSPSTALVNAASITAGWSGQLSLARGGTNANLTASNGGIFYSTGSAGAILAGTATANQVLLSGSSTTPAWSTATYPATTTANQLLYSSATNTVGGLSSANGGLLVTSNTGVPSILAGSGTTGTVIQATSGGTPAWSTATYPATTTVSQILYSSSANVVGGLSTANGGVLVTSNSGVPSILAGSGTTGTVLQATASGTPAWSTATYPATTTINQILYSSAANTVAGISTANNAFLITNGSGVPSMSTSLPSGLAFITTVDQTSASVTLAVNTQYVTDDGASLVTYTLPTTCAIGSIFRIMGFASGGWKVAQSTGQQIHVGSTATTSGATGSIASSNQYDCVELVCVAANNTFVCSSVQGNLTVV